MKKRFEFVFRLLTLFVFIFSQTSVLGASASPMTRSLGSEFNSAQAGIGQRLIPAASGPAPAANYTIASQDVFAPRQGGVLAVSNPIAAGSSAAPSGEKPSISVFRPQMSAPLPNKVFNGGLEIEPITAYNLIVDSNVLSPSSYGPNAATLGARFCNRSGSTMNDVRAYIGDYANRTPGEYPVISPVQAASNTGNATLANAVRTDFGGTIFSLEHEGGTLLDATDASRYIGTLLNNDCRTVYWLVSYPRKAELAPLGSGNWVDVTGGVKPEDDLWLPYDFWATSGATTSYFNRYVTMRNEISAMANKIWPNGDNKVPPEYVAAIQQVLGWDTWTPSDPSGATNAYPGETVTSQGIWYDFGVVGAGFDNNGDLVPDRNAWIQPIGDAGSYDPGCFNLIHTYGLLIVKFGGDTELLIPFLDQMYFEGLPEDNTGVVGLVFYEYVALDGACTAGLSPYQEVASGYDNEKFNADFGAGIPPLSSQSTNMTFDKSGDASKNLGGTVNYSLTFTLPDISASNNNTITVGDPAAGMPLTFSDSVPVGMEYVACSAIGSSPCTNVTTTTVDMNGTSDIPATLLHSKDGGTTWVLGDPGTYKSTSTSNQLILQWRLQSGVTSPASGAPYTGTVTFRAVIPVDYTAQVVNNTACLKIGNADPFTCDNHPTVISGDSAITGVAFRDDGITTGIANDGIQSGTETGIGDTNSNGSGVTVKLYWDGNGDGDYADAGDFLYATTTTNASGAYCFGGTLSGTTCTRSATDGLAATTGSARYLIVVDPADDDIPTGYGPTTTTSYTKVALPATTLYGDDATEPSDFGFAPVLSVEKRLDTSSPAAEGSTVQFTLTASNTLPGSGTNNAACVYYVWASQYFASTWGNTNSDVPQGGGSSNAQYQNPQYSTGRPDERYAYSYIDNNSDFIGLSGFNMGNMGGTITKVEAFVNMHERVNLDVSDTVIVRTYYNNVSTPINTTTFSGGTFFTGPTGTEYMLVTDLTSLRTWNWGDFSSDLTEMQLEANKGSGNTHGDIDIDAAAFRITTNGACGGSGTVLNPVPLIDEFDNRYLQFVSANPPITGQTATADPNITQLSWANVGPLYPGESKNITLTFLAKDVTGTVTTTNVDESTGAKFASGAAANSDLKTETNNRASVTITTPSQLSGYVWLDQDNQGWEGTTGYDASDVMLNGVTVELYACQLNSVNLTTTTAIAANPCTGIQQTTPNRNGAWNLISTTTTNASGYYAFTALTEGFYVTRVVPSNASGQLPTTATQRAEAVQNASGVTCTNCNNYWEPSGAAGSYLTAALNTTNFNYLSTGENILQVNFGYILPAGITGTIWHDYDGDGVIDTAEAPISGTTVYLCDSTDTAPCTAANANASYVTGADGKYFFSGLTGGSQYFVGLSANPAGYNTHTYDPDNGTTNPNRTSGLVTVTANLVSSPYNFGFRNTTNTYVIGDTLFYDWDGDSRQDGIDEGIKNVDVELYADLNNNGIIDSTDPKVSTQATDVNGTYCFGGTIVSGVCTPGASALPAGNYIVKVITSDGDFPTNVVQIKDPGEPTKIINGYIDFNADNSITTADSGYIAGTRIVNGGIDLDNDGLINGSDNGTFLNYPVYAGRMDTNGDLSGDNNDNTTIYVCRVCDSLNKVSITTASNTEQDFSYQPKGSGTIGDTVFSDLNGDGLPGVAEAGIPGVTVQLQVDLNGDNTYVTLSTQVTDANGKYLFTNLPAGTYRVLINTSDNATAIPNDPYNNEYRPTNGTVSGNAVYRTTTLGVSTTSSPDNVDLEVDFGFAPPATIGDTVYNDVNRNGTQDYSEPGISGVTVTLYTFTDMGDGDGQYDNGEPYYDLNGNDVRDSGEPFFDKDGRYQPGEPIGSAVGTTTTDTDGLYRFTGLNPGYYLVEAGYSTTQTGDPNADGVSCDNITYQVRMLNADADKGTICDERDGMRLYYGTTYLGADFGYQVNSGSIGDTLWVDSNNNGQRDAGEAGIDQVTVYLCATSPCNSSNDIANTETDADGNYMFTGLVAGTYYVAVDTADSNLTSLGLTQSFERNVVSPASPDNESVVTLEDIGSGVIRITNINNTGCSNCDLDVDFGYRYSGGTSISGTVCLETVSADGVCGGYTTNSGVTPGAESAFSNVLIYLYKLVETPVPGHPEYIGNGKLDPGETTVLVGTATTDANGDYIFNDMANGVYYIIAIGAPQDNLDLSLTNGTDTTATQSAVNTGGDTSTTQYIESQAFDGDTLGAYQVINTSGDTSVTDRDFAFEVNTKGNYDFGDLPESYATTLQGVPDGPRHTQALSGTYTTYLGSIPDTEANGTPTNSASGDGADEDGVYVPSGGLNTSWNDSDGGTLNLTVTGSGWLVGWIDLNKNGTFADAGEMIVSQAITSTTDGDITIPSLKNLADGNYYARFRIFTSQPLFPGLAYTGSSTDGEVEDYLFTVSDGVPTPVTIAYFTSHQQGNAVGFEWSTSTEFGNVGFNLYVEKDGERRILNKQLIPSNTVDSLERQDYSFTTNANGNIFYLEEVSVLGESNLHGPFHLGETYGTLIEEDKIDWNAIQIENSTYRSANAPSMAAATTANSINLKVRQTGLHRITYEMLRDAGLDLINVAPKSITLTNRGQLVPIYLVLKGTRFGPGSYFDFYGQDLDTPYTDTNVYTVQVRRATNPRILGVSVDPSKTITPPASFTDKVAVNNQRAYASFYALEDGWYDTSMLAYATPKSWDFPFEVKELADPNAPASLELVVWGVTDWPRSPDHHLVVSINGVEVANELFNGLVVHTIQANVPAGVLRSGTNTLQLTLPGDTGVTYDMVNLDKFSLSYQRTFQAQDGRLTFTATGKLFKVTNLPARNVSVYRLTKNGPVRVNIVQVQSAGATYNATFAGTGQQTTYLVSVADAMYAPVFEAVRAPVGMEQPAQYLIISHPNFISGIQPLVQARQAQGMTVNVVDVNDVYAKYSNGIFDPYAIQQYIAYAKQNLGTQYVLLVGGDTYDYRNYLGKNSISFIPSLYADTGTSRLVPVDPLFADTNGDKLPDLAIGRFPVRTNAELGLMVNKTLAYDQKDYDRTAFFVSDMFDDAVSFKNANIGFINAMPSGWTVESTSLDDVDVSDAQTQLLDAMNRGTALITFTGHSSPTMWTYSGLFNTKTAATLTNAGRPFVAVQWGCWNTYYVDPANNYLVQSLLVAGDGGAVALMGASTLTDSTSEEMLGRILTPRLVAQGTTIGQALQQAKSELAQTHPELLDVLLGWTLMGDPTLMVEP